MPHSAIAVFTGNSVDEILKYGGSASWVVAEKQAGRQQYLVCIRNTRLANFPDPEPHGTAFLVGRINGLMPNGFDRKGMQRYLIQLKDYCRVDLPDKWGDWRNPVKYTTLEELGIDLTRLKFKPMPKAVEELPAAVPPTERPRVRPLTIAEAKQGLALQLGVPLDAIEIHIKA